MKIITISREFGSGGRELGKRLADELGIPCYDHEIIDMVAEKHGFDKNYVAHISEKEMVWRMKQVDRERAAYRELFTEETWGDKESYHLCINTSGKEIKTLVPAIAEYVQIWFN
ncbi:MAG: cytidylate kinase-like family protein [Lachnospiraceae bacterium]|nr:cytidylate kinase-like family protein [Lachnospiraceae bacterium]